MSDFPLLGLKEDHSQEPLNPKPETRNPKPETLNPPFPESIAKGSSVRSPLTQQHRVKCIE